MRLLLLTGLLVAPVSAAVASPPPPAAYGATEMAYCTPADVEAKYDTKTLAQRTGDAQGVTIDEGKLDAAIDDFAALMAPYVRERYGPTAFGVDEPMLRALNVEGAYVELAKRKPGGMADGDRADLVRLIDQLRGVAAGRVALVVPLGSAPSLPSLAVVDAFRGNPRQFGRRRWVPPVRPGGAAGPLA